MTSKSLCLTFGGHVTLAGGVCQISDGPDGNKYVQFFHYDPIPDEPRILGHKERIPDDGLYIVWKEKGRRRGYKDCILLDSKTFNSLYYKTGTGYAVKKDVCVIQKQPKDVRKKPGMRV